MLVLFLVLAVQTALAQQRTVSGTVLEENGPLPGANIIVKGSDRGTQTDFDGNFTLKNVVATDVLVISYVGFKDQEVQVGDKSLISILLEKDNTLDEVVVVAYGSQKKSTVTAATSTVKAEDLAQVPLASFEQILQGRAELLHVLGYEVPLLFLVIHNLYFL